MSAPVVKTTDKKHEEKSVVKEHKPPNILPYIIIFSLLTLVALGAFTWLLGEWYRDRQCFTNPNIWCYDSWQCNTNCTIGTPAADTEGCFTRATGPTGLASCVFGPTSALATLCLTGNSGATADPACSCVLPTSESANNCFAGCPEGLTGVAPGADCCCCPGAPGCKYTIGGEGPPLACNWANAINCPQP